MEPDFDRAEHDNAINRDRQRRIYQWAGAFAVSVVVVAVYGVFQLTDRDFPLIAMLIAVVFMAVSAIKIAVLRDEINAYFRREQLSKLTVAPTGSGKGVGTFSGKT